METAAAESKALDATAALARFQQFINNVDTAAREYGKSKEAMLFEFATLKKDLLSAFKATPLPVDCKPDAARVQSLATAVDATNAAATQHGFGETMRSDPAAGSP
jgi:CII-binding regulator of phage lambda lysogenization HflD